MRNPYLHLASNHGYTTDKKRRKKHEEMTFANDRIKWSRAHDHDTDEQKKNAYKKCRTLSSTAEQSHRDPTEEKKNYSI